VVFGAGLVFVVAPVTATALAALEDRRAGIASGVNNAVARTASLVAVAVTVLPLVAGLSGDDYRNAPALTDAFHTAMLATAAVAALGGALAWLTIRSDVLERATKAAEPEAADRHFTHCAIAGPPLRSASGQHEAPAATAS
jgi:ABC-type phosphate transport system permease subunit